MQEETSRGLSLKKNVAWNTVGSIVYQGCLWLLTVLVVRLSSDYQNSGMLAIAMTVGNVYFILGTYSMRVFQVSDVTHRFSTGNYSALRLITVNAGYIVCSVYALAVSPSLSTFYVVMAFLLFKGDAAFADLLYALDQEHLRLDYAGKSQIARGVICVTVFSAGMIVFDNLALTLLFVFFGCLVITLLYDIPRSRSLAGSLHPLIARKTCLYLLKTCLPMMLGSAIGALIVSTARQYFGLVYGESALGIYASVATPSVIIQVLAQNIYSPFLGPLSEKYRSGDLLGTRKSARNLLLMVLTIAICVTIVMSIFAEPLLVFIYGESIRGYTYLLPYVLVVATLITECVITADLLIVLDHLKLTLAVNSIAFFVDLLLIAPFTACWYMNGINFSLICAYSVAILFGIIKIFRIASKPWPGMKQKINNTSNDKQAS